MLARRAGDAAGRLAAIASRRATSVAPAIAPVATRDLDALAARRADALAAMGSGRPHAGEAAFAPPRRSIARDRAGTAPPPRARVFASLAPAIARDALATSPPAPPRRRHPPSRPPPRAATPPVDARGAPPPRGLPVGQLKAELARVANQRAGGDGLGEYDDDDDDEVAWEDVLGAAMRAMALERDDDPLVRVVSLPARRRRAMTAFRAASVTLKRVTKMNKHKHRKRRKRDRNKSK